MRVVRNMKFAFVVLAVAFAAISCVKEKFVSDEERERVSLEAWIKINEPDLLENYQENGGYYVEIIDRADGEEAPTTENNFGSQPIMDQDTCWVYLNMTGRDINGAVCLTRDYKLAQMCGTFSYSTHYTPYVCYAGSVNMGLVEGSYLSMRNELKVGDGTYKLRKGSKVRLYLPSSIAYGKSGSMAEGGYEGQYALDASRPLIMDMEVMSVIKNPSELELEMLRHYVGADESWILATKPESEKADANDDLSLKGLYYNLNFNPATENVNDYKYLQPDRMDVSPASEKLYQPYSDNKLYGEGKMAEVSQKINEILLERFGEGLSEDKRTDATQVTMNGRAKVWYVLRFLDGFVVDTNIAEIRELVFGETAPECEVFSYSPSDDEGKDPSIRQAIGAWYYGIPKMHFGAYGQILTTSGYAYGSSGMSGSTSTETSSSTGSYYNSMDYYNYYNSYYNDYNSYYNYYDYYNYYNYDYTSEETTTKVTISTEILPYTPLIFTLYVEPYE